MFVYRDRHQQSLQGWVDGHGPLSPTYFVLFSISIETGYKHQPSSLTLSNRPICGATACGMVWKITQGMKAIIINLIYVYSRGSQY